MKYNAEDILHQSFERRFRGYDTAQVHEFLQSMAREWDFFLSEITTLQTTVAEQSDELKDLRKRERGLLDALNTARELAQEMELKAQQRSAAIVAEAQERADKLVEQAQRQQKRLQLEIQELRQQRGRVDLELRSVLDSHLRLLDADSQQQMADSELDIEEEVDEHRSVTAPRIHRRPRPQVDVEDAMDEVDDLEGETLIGLTSVEAAAIS